MSPIEQFFLDLNARWAPSDASRLRLAVIGSSALFLQTSYQRGTKDADVLEVPPFDAATAEALLRIAGRGSPLHKRHRIYLEVVRSGVPFLPQNPSWHPAPFGEQLSNLDLRVLDVVDVVVSKIKRFSANDRADIDAMARHGRLPHAALVERFQDAIEWHKGDASAERIPDYVRNLNQVERDMLGVAESVFDLDDIHY